MPRRHPSDLTADELLPIMRRMAETILFYSTAESWHGVYMMGDGPMTEDWSSDYDDPVYPDGKPGKMARETIRDLHSHGLLEDLLDIELEWIEEPAQ